MAAVASGTVLHKKYRVERLVAEGGMSRIYLAHPVHGAGLVAIKQLCVISNEADAAEDLRQFRMEYDLLAALSHPGLPHALDFFSESGEHFLVEEFVPGETLQDRIETLGRLAPSEALKLAHELLDVLDYLHERKIIYRDIKPSNVLIRRDGAVRLVDFGAARRWRQGAQRDTVPLGTPGFASPEHYGSAQTDARSDIYSVGAVLHYMLTGLDPAEGEPWKFTPPHTVHQDLPQPLSAVVMTALHLDAARRFQSVRSMRRAMLDLRDETGSIAAVLLTRSRRLQYTQPQEYYRVLETLGIGLFGVFFFAVSIPAWFANVPLPHPLVGAWLTAYAFAHPYSNWKRYRRMVVEIFTEGFRVEDDDGSQALLWGDVRRLTVSQRSAEVYGASGHVHLDAAWPGFSEVVREVILGAGLVERTASAPWYQYVDTGEKIYER